MFCGDLPTSEAANKSLDINFHGHQQVYEVHHSIVHYFLQLGNIISIDGNELSFAGQTFDLNLYLSFSLEQKPNRNLLNYIDAFTFKRDRFETMCRGTLRNSEFTQLIYGFKFLTFMSRDEFEVNKNNSWINYLLRLIDKKKKKKII